VELNKQLTLKNVSTGKLQDQFSKTLHDAFNFYKTNLKSSIAGEEGNACKENYKYLTPHSLVYQCNFCYKFSSN